MNALLFCYKVTTTFLLQLPGNPGKGHTNTFFPFLKINFIDTFDIQNDHIHHKESVPCT